MTKKTISPSHPLRKEARKCLRLGLPLERILERLGVHNAPERVIVKQLIIESLPAKTALVLHEFHTRGSSMLFTDASSVDTNEGGEKA